MRRIQTGLVGLAALTCACSCGNGGGEVDAMLPVDAAVVDVAPPDAPPSPGPEGAWTVTEYDDPGGTLGTTGPDRVNGTLEMTQDGTLGSAMVFLRAGRLPLNSTTGSIAPYTRTGDMIDWQGSILTWTQGPPESLEHTEPTLAAMWARYTHSAVEMLPVQGQIDFIDSGVFTPIVTPRVGLVFLLRPSSGDPNIIEVPGGDMAITGFGANMTDLGTFDLSRTEGALGVERITFGSASISMGLVILYDDVNGNGMLDTLWTSCGAGEDCVRGVSQLVLGYRVGSSPELLASPFAFIRSGWTAAVPVIDHRPVPEQFGLISTDRNAEQPPFDIHVPTDPTDVVLPDFQL
jgi:hypothetical protein